MRATPMMTTGIARNKNHCVLPETGGLGVVTIATGWVAEVWATVERRTGWLLPGVAVT